VKTYVFDEGEELKLAVHSAQGVNHLTRTEIRSEKKYILQKIIIMKKVCVSSKGQQSLVKKHRNVIKSSSSLKTLCPSRSRNLLTSCNALFRSGQQHAVSALGQIKARKKNLDFWIHYFSKTIRQDGGQGSTSVRSDKTLGSARV
jgi:hypothetical protein